MQRIICVLIVLAATMLLAAETDDVAQGAKALQGKWHTVAGEAQGKPFSKDGIPPFTIVIAGNGKSTGQMPKNEFRFTITVDPTKKPKTIENLFESGDEKGKKQYGIYKLEGDRFTVCVTPASSAKVDRPKDFATKDTKNVVFVFERVKENKKP